MGCEYIHSCNDIVAAERTPHIHNYYKIFYVIDGEYEYTVENKVYVLMKQEVAFIAPKTEHFIKKTGSNCECIIINLDKTFFEIMNCHEYLNAFDKEEQFQKINSEAVRKSGIQGCFKRIERYVDEQKNYRNPVVRGIIVEILYLANNPLINVNVTDNRIYEIIDYIDSNYNKNITLSSIAENFFISKSHLSREFHKITGCTLTSYIKRKRLDSAVIKVKCGESVLKAAMDSGFGDYTSFYRAFHKEYGCAPKAFLKNL